MLVKRVICGVRIEEIESVYVTHFEAEHIGGLEVVLQETGLDHFYGPVTGRWDRCRGLGEGKTVPYDRISVTAFHTPGQYILRHAHKMRCQLTNSPFRCARNHDVRR